MKHWIDDIHQLWHFPIDLRYPEFVQYCWLNCKNLLLRAPVWKCGEKQTLRYWTLSLHCGFLFGPRREWFKWCREVVQLMKLYGAGTAPTAGWKRSVAHPVSSHSSWHYTVTRLFVSHFTGKNLFLIFCLSHISMTNVSLPSSLCLTLWGWEAEVYRKWTVSIT